MLHLLLIEDNPADVFLVREALRRSAIAADVTVAYDGEEGLKLLQQQGFQPDFVILDLSLPNLSGHAVLEQYRSASPPIVVFTGSADEQDRERALAHGAKEYVTKAGGFEGFLEAVQGIVERWGGSAKSSG